jgi:hypothetical protein
LEEAGAKDLAMIDLIYKLDSFLPLWPAGTQKTLKELADAIDTSIPNVLQCFSEGLTKEIDVTGTISPEEAASALELLQRKFRSQIEARERQLAKQRELSVMAYDKIMEKTRIQQLNGNFHIAFRTLGYFLGEYEKSLPDEVLSLICSDAIRFGIKSKENIQELGRWLQKAIATAMRTQGRGGIEEALDLLDAYGEHFINEESGKGSLIVGNILATLEEPAARFELWEQYKAIVGQLYP